MASYSGYASSYAERHRVPTGWWEHAAQVIHWEPRWDRVFDPHDGPHGRWFKSGILNTSFNCLDRHVTAGRHDQAAVIWDSPMTGQVVRISYLELLNQVAKLAGALAALGVNKGDRGIIYMPMVVESVVAMRACARLGAVHCVVYDGFAAPELANRINDVVPRAIVSASCGLEPTRVVEYKPLIDHALELCAAPERFALFYSGPC